LAPVNGGDGAFKKSLYASQCSTASDDSAFWRTITLRKISRPLKYPSLMHSDALRRMLVSNF
jgi:hypothetical protein